MATACIPQITLDSSPKASRSWRRSTNRMPVRTAGGPAEEPRHPIAADEAAGRLLGGHPPAGQGAASGPGGGAATRLGLACGYADCNDAARLADDAIHKLLLDRIDRGPRPGLAADPVAVRERGAMGCLARHGARLDRHRDRDAPAAAQGAGDADHHLPLPYRRPDPRPAGAHPLQRPLRTRATCRSWRR